MADETRRKRKGGILVWAVLGLLVLALGGFGIGGFGGSATTVATVGDRTIDVNTYARSLQNEQQRLQQRTGQPLTLQQMQAFGLDRLVMERLLAEAALANEAERMGLSVGDAEVADRIRATPAFGGLDGGFDREAYAFALRNAGLNERAYERQIRDAAARDILQAAVIGGAPAPAGYAERIAAWLGESRTITLAPVATDLLAEGVTAPTEAELEAFLSENAARFTRPEQRRITYALLTPEMLLDDVAPSDDELRETYEARSDLYRQPRRILAERLAFADGTAAADAAAAIEAGETRFETLVEERGLTLADVDQGELSEADLEPGIAAALFALDEPGIVGPVETPLGPALYRVNAVLDATETPFEDVRDDLAAELSSAAATRRIASLREDLVDLLAGGATIEEMGEQTDMERGEIVFDADTREGVAAYAAFRDAAASVQEGDFPELIPLRDGGLVALRLDGVEPAAVPPLGEIRAEVEAAWQEDALTRRLTERAEALADRIADGESFEAVGLTPETVADLARDGQVPDAPRALTDRAFAMQPGEASAVPGDATRAYVVRLDEVQAADLDDGEAAELVAAIRAEARREVAADLFDAYGRAVQAETGFEIDQATVQAVQSQMLGQGGG